MLGRFASLLKADGAPPGSPRADDDLGRRAALRSGGTVGRQKKGTREGKSVTAVSEALWEEAYAWQAIPGKTQPLGQGPARASK